MTLIDEVWGEEEASFFAVADDEADEGAPPPPLAMVGSGLPLEWACESLVLAPAASGAQSPPPPQQPHQQPHQQQQLVGKQAKKKKKPPPSSGSGRGKGPKEHGKTCINCRLSRLKCDHQFPCSRCVLRFGALVCLGGVAC
jgi:hypothetical protein